MFVIRAFIKGLVNMLGSNYYSHELHKHVFPEDTATKLHLMSTNCWTLQNLIEFAQEKWGDSVSLEDIEMSSEKIQTRCFGYDLYDGGDYTDFIILEYKGDGQGNSTA